MAIFPVLSSGAVAQYPVTVVSRQNAQVIRFMDGSDQRFLMQRQPLRQWQIRLNLLNETEIQQLEAFFTDASGDYSTFVFPDPVSGNSVPNCRLAAPGLLTDYLAVDNSSASFWIVETYG